MKVILGPAQPWKVVTPKKKVPINPQAPQNYQKVMDNAFKATKTYGMSPEQIQTRKRTTLSNAAQKLFGGLK